MLLKLGDLGQWGSGGTPLASRRDYYDGDIPWVVIEDLTDGVVPRARRTITRAGLGNSAAKIVPSGTLLIAMYGSIGKLGISGISCATNQAIAFCQPDPAKVNLKFLFYWLLNERRNFVHAGRGGTQQNISQEFLKDYDIRLPSLPEQERVARLLEQANRLRCARRYALELSETFLPAAFLELFGDPRTSARRWPVEELELLGTMDRGRSKHRPRNALHLYGGPYPFIQTGDVAQADGYIRSHIQAYSEEGLKQSKLWLTGTLCITIAANIAATAILTYPACFPDSIVGFTPGDKIRVEFVRFWLSFLQKELEKSAPEVAQKNINLEILRELRCPVPPLELQDRFATLVARQERLRANQREALRQAEHLFQSLLHHAFATT